MLHERVSMNARSCPAPLRRPAAGRAAPGPPARGGANARPRLALSRRMRRLMFLLLLLPGACAAPPRPEPPLPYPPAARERMLRIVLAEWADWGSLRVSPGQRPASSQAESDPAN